MKFLIVAIACLAVVAADVSHLAQADGYHYDAPHHEEVAPVPAPAPAPEYLPPQQEEHHHEEHHHEETAPAPVPAPAPAPEYLPPQQEAEPTAELGNDGYRYRAVKRFRYRYRS